jgi:hypothetical protein
MSIRNSRAFLHLALGVSLLTNALLVMQNRQYANRMTELISRQGLQRGGLLRTMNGFDLSGSPVVLDFSKTQQPVVVLVVSASCGACARSWRAWSTLIESLRRQNELNRLVVLDVTDGVDKAYARKHNIDGVLCVTKIDPAQKWFYNLRLTPQTVFVNPGGSIELVVSGIPEPDAIAAILSRVRTGYIRN